MSKSATGARPRIPIVPAAGAQGAASPAEHACSGAESFALMVLGDSMAPEFAEGDIVIIEPEGLATDGSYVLAFWQDEWVFRQLARADGGWRLRALNPRYPDIALPSLEPVRGVITQKTRPGRRRAVKRYVE
jgi:SOS-response transcriptional repressor LexA